MVQLWGECGKKQVTEKSPTLRTKALGQRKGLFQAGLYVVVARCKSKSQTQVLKSL